MYITYICYRKIRKHKQRENSFFECQVGLEVLIAENDLELLILCLHLPNPGLISVHHALLGDAGVEHSLVSYNPSPFGSHFNPTAHD